MDRDDRVCEGREHDYLSTISTRYSSRVDAPCLSGDVREFRDNFADFGLVVLYDHFGEVPQSIEQCDVGLDICLEFGEVVAVDLLDLFIVVELSHELVEVIGVR
jgi:hypothetical protein